MPAVNWWWCIWCTEKTRWSCDDVYGVQKKHDDPVHILNVAIRYDTQEEDDTYAAVFEDFCAEKVRKYLCFYCFNIWLV